MFRGQNAMEPLGTNLHLYRQHAGMSLGMQLYYDLIYFQKLLDLVHAFQLKTSFSLLY